MPSILVKKAIYYGDTDSTYNGWVWGRWLLFIIFIVVLILYVFLLNVRRRKNGRDPIRGTAWLAPPPSYGNSQNQYNQPVDQNPVPIYTANANANDAGFFDQEGKFHPTNPESSEVPRPEPAVTREGRNSLPTTNSSSSIEYQRPTVPPPTEPAYERPAGPPPVATPTKHS